MTKEKLIELISKRQELAKTVGKSTAEKLFKVRLNSIQDVSNADDAKFVEADLNDFELSKIARYIHRRK